MNNKYLIYGAMGLAGDWSSEQPLKQAEIDDGINVLESVIDNPSKEIIRPILSQSSEVLK